MTEGPISNSTLTVSAFNVVGSNFWLRSNDLKYRNDRDVESLSWELHTFYVSFFDAETVSETAKSLLSPG